MKIGMFSGIALTVTFAGNAHAENHDVDQESMVFVPLKLVIASGDLVTFHNREKARAHHVRAKSDSADMMSGLIRPGEDHELVFEQPGLYEVSCNIHPKMKMEIVVE